MRSDQQPIIHICPSGILLSFAMLLQNFFVSIGLKAPQCNPPVGVKKLAGIETYKT